MIGHAEILTKRLQGLTPESAWVHVLEFDPSAYMKRDAHDSIANGFKAQILILPNESVASLDLSGLEGMTVHLEGSDRLRCDAVMKQVTKYADRVLRFTDGVLMDWRANHDALA